MMEMETETINIITWDWGLVLFLVLLFFSVGLFFWVTCSSPFSSLSRTMEDCGLRFLVREEGSFSVMVVVTLELCWSTQLIISWWRGWNCEGGGGEAVFMLSMNDESTRKGWYWYEKAAMMSLKMQLGCS